MHPHALAKTLRRLPAAAQNLLFSGGRQRLFLATASAAAASLSAAGPAQAAGEGTSSVNMSPGVTSVGQSIFDLHMTILWICVAIGLGVFGVMFYSII
jgi:cytochrome c oxidase subunit 2